MRFGDREPDWRRWLGALLLLVWTGTAEAFSGGITTNSLPIPAQGCNFCHLGGSAPTVTLECVDCGGAPPVVAPLSVHEFKLTVFAVGLQTQAGLNVSSLTGTLATGGAFAAGTQALAGSGGRQEITHTAPKVSAGGQSEFSFLWAAPAAAGPVTLTGWGNAVTGDGSTAGDAASLATLNVSVAGDTPTPTDTPLPTDTPTPTATPAPACPAAVDAGCETGFGKGLLLVKAAVPGKEKLVAKLLQGPALAQTDMGNPLGAAEGGTGTEFALCVYDHLGALAGAARVARAGALCGALPCWKPIGRAPNDPQGPGTGYRYKDRDLAADGVLKILYKGGAAGKSKVILVGKGSNLPDGIAAGLQSATHATMQLRSSDGVCLSIDLHDIKRQDATFFSAR